MRMPARRLAGWLAVAHAATLGAPTRGAEADGWQPHAERSVGMLSAGDAAGSLAGFKLALAAADCCGNMRHSLYSNMGTAYGAVGEVQSARESFEPGVVYNALMGGWRFKLQTSIDSCRL